MNLSGFVLLAESLSINIRENCNKTPHLLHRKIPEDEITLYNIKINR